MSELSNPMYINCIQGSKKCKYITKYDNGKYMCKQTGEILSKKEYTLERCQHMYKANKNKNNLYLETQYYKDIPFRLINRKYGDMKAKRFVINETNQNVWIPNKHLTLNGKLKENENIDYVFRKAINQLNIAGITQAIPGIKRDIKNQGRIKNV